MRSFLFAQILFCFFRTRKFLESHFFVSKFAISFCIKNKSFKILITILISVPFQSYVHHQATENDLFYKFSFLKISTNLKTQVKKTQTYLRKASLNKIVLRILKLLFLIQNEMANFDTSKSSMFHDKVASSFNCQI